MFHLSSKSLISVFRVCLKIERPRGGGRSLPSHTAGSVAAVSRPLVYLTGGEEQPRESLSAGGQMPLAKRLSPSPPFSSAHFRHHSAFPSFPNFRCVRILMWHHRAARIKTHQIKVRRCTNSNAQTAGKATRHEGCC